MSKSPKLNRLIFTSIALSLVLVVGGFAFLALSTATSAQKREVKGDRSARPTSPAANFTTGSLVIYRVGTGAAALTNSSTAGFLDEYTTAPAQVAPVQSIALPIADAGANQTCTNAGSSTTEGLLTRSANGAFLLFGCYDVAPGTVNVAGTSTGTVLRVVGRADAAGIVDTSTTTTSFSGGNIRSATSDNGTNIWMSGSNTGVVYNTFGGSGAGTIVSPAPSNLRQINIFNSQLYVTSGSGASIGIDSVGSGLPTTAAVVSLTGAVTGASNATPIVITTADTTGLLDGQTVTVSGISGGTTPNGNANCTCYVDVLSSTTFALYVDKNLTIGRAGSGPNLGTGAPTWTRWTNPTALEVASSGTSPLAFFFARLGSGPAYNGFDTAYVADDGGTIQKHSFNGTSWAANGTIALASVRGMTGTVNGTNVTLYVTNPTTLQSLTDTSGFNGTITGTLAVLATAGTNTAFRGVAFAPVSSTAAGVGISGRVMTSDGRGITNAVVTIMGNSLSQPRNAVTGRGGSYIFDDLEPGETYIVTVRARRFMFSNPSQVISIVDNVSDADFVADGVASRGR